MLVPSSRAAALARPVLRTSRNGHQRSLATVPPPPPPTPVTVTKPTSHTTVITPPAPPPGAPLIPPPPRAKRSPFRRFVVLTSLGALVFYGGSTYASLKSPMYADFFTERVPGGDTLVDAAERSPWTQSLKSTDMGEVPHRAVEVVSAGYNRVSGAIQRVIGDASDKIDDAREEGTKIEKKGQEAITEGRKSLRGMVSKVERKVDEAELKEKATQAVKKAENKGNEGVEKVEEKSQELLGRAKKAMNRAEEEVKKNTPIGGRGTGTTTFQEQAAAATAKNVPTTHESSTAATVKNRQLRAETNDPLVRLRDPPALPSLPRLAPSLSSLSGSEPMIAQLAGTVDELAAFLRETPNSGTQARAVLDDAKKDLAKLYERLEQVKKTEAEKLKKGLESQKNKYDAELKKAADNARAQVGKIDEKWKKEQEALRQKEASEYEDKLKKELATQSEIINERLKEEVVGQGIEMQRRWMKEIKTRVDAERGGRLAKLDELAKDLGDLQKISLDNSQALEENASAIAVDAALRELSAVALDEQEEIGTKAPFVKQLEKAKKSVKGKEQNNDLLLEVLEQLNSSKPEEGVESFSTLYSWFTQKVRPAVQRVALVPENSGILSHLMSSTLSPFLFGKSGFPQGDDVPAVLARSQFYLERRDLDNAAREINQLKGWPKILAEDWLQAARKRLEVEQHVQLAQVEAHFTSLQTA